ncbi:hypothetical protein TSUD_214910 [Trifolium subterraneum]|uniref:GH16 domain-containing protein n=1 Tax=Trifolium subterraneum TaxID=3900 RepID=A0A2Z6N4X8_TRISU|nr:hypothetical protein TSUD_214910 [Trifolium subterraneum]
MASSYANNSVFLMLCLCLAFSTIAFGGNFNTDFNILFGDKRANIEGGGNNMTLTMDKYSGSGIGTKNEYLFGRFDMQIRLVPGNSAGTVTAYYILTCYNYKFTQLISDYYIEIRQFMNQVCFDALNSKNTKIGVWIV